MVTSEASQPTSSGEKRRLVVNTLLNGSAQVASILASIVLMPLLIRAFGLVGYGLFMLASSVVAYAALLDLGVGSALTKLVAEHATKGDTQALRQAVSSALLFYTLVGFTVAAAMLLVGAAVGSIFDVDQSGAILLRDMLWLGAVFQLVYWPASTGRHVLAGLQRYDVLAVTGVLATVLSIVAAVVVLFTGRGPLLLVGLNGAVIAVVSIANVAMARRLSRVRSAALSGASRLQLATIFSFSWAVFVVQIVDVVFYQQTDRLLLGILAGAAAVGLYEAAAKFNALITYLAALTVSAVLPLASSMGAEGRTASLRSLFVRGTKYGAALIAPVTIVLAVFASPLIEVWLGPGFAGQGVVAQVLILPHVIVSLGLMGDTIVISQGRLGRRIPWIVLQAVVNVVLSALLIPRIGVMGVAIGTMVAHLLDFPIHIRFLLQETGVGFVEWIREIVAPVYPLLVIPLLVGVALARTPLAGSLAGIVLAAGAALAAYWGAWLVFGLSRVEKAEIRSALAAIRGRSPIGGGTA